MFRQLWLSALLLGVMSGTALAQTESQKRPEQGSPRLSAYAAKQQQPNRAKPTPQVLLGSDAKNASQRNFDLEAQTAPDYRWRGDTIPQWIMAIAAGLGVIIGLLTLELLRRTLNATRLAASYAEDAANAARDSVAEAKATTEIAKAAAISNADQVQRELRAYLSVEPLGIAALDDWTTIIGHVAVRNVGKIPAKNVFVYTRMKLSDKDDSSFNIATDREEIQRSIQPGAFMRQGTQDTFIARDIASAIPDTNVYVYGVVYYNDGFNERRYTRFCHRYAVASYDRGWAKIENISRTMIQVEKARYHIHGNNSN